MLKAFVLALSLCVISVNGEDIITQLVSSNGEITAEIRKVFLEEKKAQMLKAASDSGFTIRASTISYIDNSKLLYEGVYGTFTKSDPHIIRNLDSLLIYAENDGNETFWDNRHNLLLGAAIGRRGFGVGEHKVILQHDLKPALKSEIQDLESAKKEGLTYGDWLEKEYNRLEKQATNRREKYADLLKSVQDTILSWVGKEKANGIGNRESWYGYRKAGLLENDEFMYARVSLTDSLKPRINRMLKAADYSGDLFTALMDVKDLYCPIKTVHNNQMAVYDFFKDLIAWQETPKANLDWNPAINQGAIDNVAHPIYKTSEAPWQLITLLSRSFRKNELEWVRKNYLGYISHRDKSKTDTTQVYIPKVHGYGPYRKNDLNSYKLIAHPLDGYVKLIRVGGVCGTMSSIGQQVNTALGKPVVKAGQPGHSCTVVYRMKNGNNFVSIGQGSGASMEKTSTLNILRDTEYNFSGNSFVNVKGLVYGLNISEESWITSRIAYSLWKGMNGEEKDNIGVEMMTKALEKNGGYTEAVYALLRYSQKQEDSLFSSTFQRVIDGVEFQKNKYGKSTDVFLQCAEYKDLLTFHFIESAFNNNSYWPVSSSLGLIEWLETFILAQIPPVNGADYKNQPTRLWNTSKAAKTAVAQIKTRRRVANIRVTPPKVKDGITETGNRDPQKLVDGNDEVQYRLEYGDHVATGTPFEFIFTFPEVYPVETMEMVHWTPNNTVKLRVKDYDIYWSDDSVHWNGPHSGRFTRSRLQTLNFDADTTITTADTIDVVDSNGIVIDFEVIEPETLIVTNPVNMRYLKYIPKTNHKEDPFKGVIAQEFSFYFTPDLTVPLSKLSTHSKGVVLNSQGITIPVVTKSLLKVINVKGQIIDRIYPQLLGDRVYYPLSGAKYGNQVVILEFPTELKLKPVKLSQ